MKKSVNNHLIKALLVIAFISLAFVQWKKERIQPNANDITLFELSEK